MKKIEFEWWWLWVPVVAFTFSHFLSLHEQKGEDIVSFGIYVSLFVVSVSAIFFRPRKPHVIYAHLNSMLRRTFWIVNGAALILLWSAFGEAALKLHIPDWLSFVWLISVTTIMGLAIAYFLYWSHPYSRKRSGIAAVDAAIARYRKPGEKIDGQWIPDMVIDEKRYRAVVYLTDGRWNALLGFELDGTLVRDETLTNKIVQCVRFAENIMHADRINWRADGYKDTRKAIRLGEKALQQWSRLFRGLPAEYAGEVEWLRRGLEMWLEFAEGVCRYWYLEAEYGMRHGNTKMKEVRYEDVERLNEEVNVYRREQERLMNGEWQPVFQAAHSLNNLLYRQTQLHTAERKALIDMMLLFQGDVSYKEKKMFPYMPMTADDRRAWLSRLAWVDLVDSWVAQGYEGKALEAKKREYLAEQAQLEAERKRQEEAEKARRREEQAQKRAARKAQRKQKETKTRKESEG